MNCASHNMYHTCIGNSGHRLLCSKVHHQLLTRMRKHSARTGPSLKPVPFTCTAQMPVMAARYGGKRELQDKSQDAVRAHQDHAEAKLLSLAYARMLERVLLGQSVAVQARLCTAPRALLP